MKFNSLVAFEQENIPTALPWCLFNPAATRSIASSHVAGLSSPASRTKGVVNRSYTFAISPPSGNCAGKNTAIGDDAEGNVLVLESVGVGSTERTG